MSFLPRLAEVSEEELRLLRGTPLLLRVDSVEVVRAIYLD